MFASPHIHSAAQFPSSFFSQNIQSLYRSSCSRRTIFSSAMARYKSKKSKAEQPRPQPSTSIEQCSDLVASSKRILALCGAGLSAASGLPTFRGAGGLWRNHESTSLATPDAFRKDPALAWLFYAWRRHMVLQAKPNAGHFALAELAKKKEHFLCLTQNVDGNLSHPCCRAFLAGVIY